MLWNQLDTPDVQPRYLLNGFPKSGLHLVALMVTAVCEPVPGNVFYSNNWWGTFQYHSFTNQWYAEMDKQFYLLSRIQHGQFYKGHVGWREDVRDFIRRMCVAHVFITRDLRDVAVSQAHHVLSPGNDQLKHPTKRLYQMMNSFDEVLMAVIEGIGPLPGVLDRWELYAPWLDEDWTLHVTFEEAKANPVDVARRILHYGLRRHLDLFPVQVRIDEEWLDKSAHIMAQYGQQTDQSITFRKGQVGGWREAFKPEHVEAFKRCDVGNWLVRLGYEKDGGWTA